MKILKSRVFLAVAIVVALVGVYALLGFKVAPGIIRGQAIKFVHETYGRDLGIGEVHLDPFKLQLEVKDVSVPDADGSGMLGFRRLFVDFELESIWQRAYVFKDVIIEGPDARAVIRPDGSMNFADLAPKETEPAPEKTELPGVWLKSLVVTDGKVRFEHLARTRPFVRTFAPVAFALKDFRTTPQGGKFRLSARGEAGAGFDWNGRLELAPVVASQGNLAIHGLNAGVVGEFLEDALPFDLTSGLIEIAGTYSVSLGNVLDLQLKLPKIEVSSLGLRARGANADWIKIPSIVVSDTAVTLPAQTVAVADVTVTGLKAEAWLSPDGSINLTRLFAPGEPVATTATDGREASAGTRTTSPAKSPPAPNSGDASTLSGNPWQVTVASTELKDASIDFEDRLKEPNKQFAVAPLNVRLQNASLDLARPVPVAVDAVINGHAPFKAEGTVTPDPLAAELSISLADARMTILQPYVLPLADLTITDGRLALAGKVRLDPPDAPGPELSFTGDVAIDGFKSVDNVLHDDLVNFQQVQVRKVKYEMGPDAASVDQIIVRKAYTRVILSPERILNIAAVLDPKGTAALVEARRAEAAAEAKLTPAERRRRDKERADAEKHSEKGRKARGGTPPPALAPLPKEGMPIRIREVRIDDSTMNFTDLFVKPNFSAKIYQLAGTVTALSSDPASHAKVSLTGKVDEFSPVTIAGELQPFAFERYTDMDFKFENINLPIFNPYSGGIAGYSIAKGKLTTDLHYLIQDKKLDAQHKIRIDQLEWGEPSATKGEATLPVKFATSLLKDRNGVINLDVPVTGTLDDPKFRIGPIVWQIIKNLIVKAVTAPFALLGSLFEGAEDAQFVDFAPGSATLDATTTQRLGALSKSLVEKPEIKLDVPTGVLPDLDRPALVEVAYAEQLAGAIGATLSKGGKNGAPPPPFDSLTPKQKIEVLTALVQKQTGAEPKLPEPPPPPDRTSRDEAQALRQSAAIEYLQNEARAHVTVPDTELATLGEARAAAVQHALLAGGELEPTRVFLTKSGKITPKDGKVRFELGLQ